MQALNPRYNKPEWLRKKISFSANKEMEELLTDIGIHTICQEAKCPNISECFSKKSATFLILGNICTRRCKYCNVLTGTPNEVDYAEIDKVTRAVEKLGLKYVVITSPARDDLNDGGADMFTQVTKSIITNSNGNTKVELLIPDFKNRFESIEQVVKSGAVIVGHNIETVPRLYHIRRNSNYERSMKVLKTISELGKQQVIEVKSKSALMVGLGESESEMVRVFKDLLANDCKLLSIGQYLAPTKDYEKVLEFIPPVQFKRYHDIAMDLGFEFVLSSPYARSSYLAHEYTGEEHL